MFRFVIIVLAIIYMLATGETVIGMALTAMSLLTPGKKNSEQRVIVIAFSLVALGIGVVVLLIGLPYDPPLAGGLIGLLRR